MKLSAILRGVEGGNFSFWCPGCDELHVVAVGTPFRNGARWTFNGDVERPTFTPSIHCKSGHHADGTASEECWLCKEGSMFCTVCHSYVTDGQIEFLGDCTHALAGQTVPIPPFEAEPS